MSAQRAIRGSLSRDEVHQLQLLATTSTNYLSHQRHAQRMETTGQDQADLRFQRTASDLEKSTLIDQYKESVPHLAGTSQSLLLIPKRRALPNLPGARPHQVQPSVNTRSPNSLSPGSPISLEDVPVHHLLENLIETRQRDVDWATLMTLVHQAQTYYAAQQRIDSVSMAPLQEQGSEANAASATSLAEIRQGDQPIHKQPYESAFQKKAPRVKHARRPPPPPVSAVPLAHIKRETASTSPPLKAVKGKRKASPAPAFRVRKARKVSTSMRRQLGPDPNRPGLLILKVKLPVDGSLYKTFTPGARQQSLQPSDALGAAAGQEHLGKAIASKTRPIDLTAISTKGNAVQVPSANPGGLSAFRTRINQTVTPHLKEGMSYLAKHQPDNPLEWLAEFCRVRSLIVEGPSSSEPDSKVEAESAEDDEAGLAPPAPPPSQATTPERAPAEIEIETPPPPGQSVEHRRHRRNRSLTFDPVAAEKGVLKPPPTPDSASSADESEKCSKSAPFEAETPSKPTQASTACPPEDVPSSAPVSTSAAAAANRTLGLPQMPSLLDGQEHGTASVGTRIPGQILLVENEASCAPCEGHAPVADDVARTAQLPAVGRSPQAPGSSTSLRPDETHVLLKSDSIRHHSADAYVDPDPGGQLLEQGLVLAKPPTVQGLQATRPAIMVTEASHVNECPQQLQPGKQWDFLDKELFGSRMPTPEPPGA